jgi:hypothetical protein
MGVLLCTTTTSKSTSEKYNLAYYGVQSRIKVYSKCTTQGILFLEYNRKQKIQLYMHLSFCTFMFFVYLYLADYTYLAEFAYALAGY